MAQSAARGTQRKRRCRCAILDVDGPAGRSHPHLPVLLAHREQIPFWDHPMTRLRWNVPFARARSDPSFQTSSGRSKGARAGGGGFVEGTIEQRSPCPGSPGDRSNVEGCVPGSERVPLLAGIPDVRTKLAGCNGGGKGMDLAPALPAHVAGLPAPALAVGVQGDAAAVPLPPEPVFVHDEEALVGAGGSVDVEDHGVSRVGGAVSDVLTL